MPEAPEGEYYFDKVFTQDPEIDYLPSTSNSEYSTYPEDPVTEAEPMPTSTKKSDIPLSTPWLVVLLVVEWFVGFALGAGIFFVFRKKALKCWASRTKSQAKARSRSKSRSRSRPQPQPQPQLQPQPSVMKPPPSQKYKELDVVLEDTRLQPSQACHSTIKPSQQAEPTTTLLSFNPKTSSAAPLPSSENPDKPTTNRPFLPILTMIGDMNGQTGSLKQEASKKSISNKSMSKKENERRTKYKEARSQIDVPVNSKSELRSFQTLHVKSRWNFEVQTTVRVKAQMSNRLGYYILWSSMFGILCLACVFVLSENAWVNYETGIVALTNSSEIPEHLTDVIDIQPSNITVLTPIHYITSLYIGRKYDSADGTPKAFNFTFVPEGTCTKFGVRFYLSMQESKAFNFYFDNESDKQLFTFHKKIFTHDLNTLRMSINDGTIYAESPDPDVGLNPMNFENKYCGDTHGDLVVCHLHFQRLGDCALKMKFDPQHNVVLFMPEAPEGESYFDKVFTQDPEIDYLPSTSNSEYSTYPEDPVTEAEPMTTSTKKRAIPISTPWLVVLLVVEGFVGFALGAGILFVFRKKALKCWDSRTKSQAKTRSRSKSRSRSRPRPQPLQQPQPQLQPSVVKPQPSRKYKKLDVVLEDTCLQPSESCQSTQQKPPSQQAEPTTTLLSFNPESSSATPLPSSELPKKPAANRPYSPILTMIGNVNGQLVSLKQEISKKSASKKSASKKSAASKKSTSKKSNKSFLQRTKDKLMPQSKPASIVTPRNTPNTSTTTKRSAQSTVKPKNKKRPLILPIGFEVQQEYLENLNARKKRIAELEKKKLEQQTVTNTTFVNSEGERILGVDAEGCEYTQKSDDEAYNAQVEDDIQAKNDAEMYNRQYTPDGIPRNEQELAEYAKAASIPFQVMMILFLNKLNCATIDTKNIKFSNPTMIMTTENGVICEHIRANGIVDLVSMKTRFGHSRRFK
uniref:CUB domain-containing protein n=1 Tax=Panagrellus redivivus TaxID=6233 RepID=A0A7E4W3S5_PANRE